MTFGTFRDHAYPIPTTKSYCSRGLSVLVDCSFVVAASLDPTKAVSINRFANLFSIKRILSAPVKLVEEWDESFPQYWKIQSTLIQARCTPSYSVVMNRRLRFERADTMNRELPLV